MMTDDFFDYIPSKSSSPSVTVARSVISSLRDK